MPFIFRCDACGTEHDLPSDGGFSPSDFALNCEACGQDGCPACIENETCDGCKYASEDTSKDDIDD